MLSPHHNLILNLQIRRTKFFYHVKVFSWFLLNRRLLVILMKTWFFLSWLLFWHPLRNFFWRTIFINLIDIWFEVILQFIYFFKQFLAFSWSDIDIYSLWKLISMLDYRIRPQIILFPCLLVMFFVCWQHIDKALSIVCIVSVAKTACRWQL